MKNKGFAIFRLAPMQACGYLAEKLTLRVTANQRHEIICKPPQASPREFF